MINPNWTWRPLGELFEIGAGKTMSAAARAGADKVPFLRTSNVLWDEIDLTEVDQMAMPPSELAKKRLKAGDLLVCEGGDIGRSAVWDGRVSTMSFQNHLHRLRPIGELVDPRFYVYFLQSAFTQLGIFEGAGNRTTIPNLSRGRLAALEVPQPPIAEQRDIAQALAKVREAINTHAKASAAAQELKAATMREVFTRGLHDEMQKDTEIGLVPESWAVLPCENLTQNITVGVVVKPASYYVAEGVPAFRSLNIKEDRIDASNLVYFSAEDNDGVLFKSKLRAGDVVIVRTGYPGTSAVVPPIFDGANCIDLVVVRPNGALVLGTFLSRFLNSEQGKAQALSNSHGLAQKHLNVGAVRQVRVPVPSQDEQRDIVAILDAIDRKVELHRRKGAVLDELFKSLLHRLMTGDIRVEDLDLSALSLTPAQAVTQ